MNRFNLITTFIILTLIISIFSGCSSDDDASDEVNTTNTSTTVVFNPDLTYGEMVDQDGNKYKTINIGTQTWMAENLRTTKYRNGDPILQITNNLSWNPLDTGACCTYNNTTDLSEIATYGRLYNWFAVSDSRNVAPEGWRVATDADWDTLVTYLGDIAEAGGKMKESGSLHWLASESDSTNSSGFSAIPGGYRDFYDGSYEDKGEYGYYWSTLEYDSSKAYFRYLYYNDATCKKFYYNKVYGLSVRCVKE